MSSDFTGFAWPKVGSASTTTSYWHSEPAPIEMPVPVADAVEDDRAKGFDAGYAEGKAAAEMEISKTLSLLDQAASELERVGREQTRSHLGEVVDVVQYLFRRIFSMELSVNPDLLDKIRDSLTRVWEEEASSDETLSQGAVVIRFSAADLAEQTLLGNTQEGPTRIVPDPNLPSGVVRIQQGSALRELDLCTNLDAVIAKALADPDAFARTDTDAGDTTQDSGECLAQAEFPTAPTGAPDASPVIATPDTSEANSYASS